MLRSCHVGCLVSTVWHYCNDRHSTYPETDFASRIAADGIYRASKTFTLQHPEVFLSWKQDFGNLNTSQRVALSGATAVP